MSTAIDSKQVRVSAQAYEMLEILKKERGSVDDVIKDMLSEFAPSIYETVMRENNENVEIEGFGTPKYAQWREKVLKSSAKLTYAEFKKREWRRIEDGEDPSVPRIAQLDLHGKKIQVVPF